jgi:hypothetical protein
MFLGFLCLESVPVRAALIRLAFVRTTLSAQRELVFAVSMDALVAQHATTVKGILVQLATFFEIV